MVAHARGPLRNRRYARVSATGRSASRVLADSVRRDRVSGVERGRRLGPEAPLFWSNVALHGTFELDLNKRLDYDRGPEPSASHEPDQ